MQKWSDIVNEGAIGEGALEWSSTLYEVLVASLQKQAEWAAEVCKVIA